MVYQKKLKTSFLVDFFNILSDWGLFWGQNIWKNFFKDPKAPWELGFSQKKLKTECMPNFWLIFLHFTKFGSNLAKKNSKNFQKTIEACKNTLENVWEHCQSSILAPSIKNLKKTKKMWFLDLFFQIFFMGTLGTKFKKVKRSICRYYPKIKGKKLIMVKNLVLKTIFCGPVFSKFSHFFNEKNMKKMIFS